MAGYVSPSLHPLKRQEPSKSDPVNPAGMAQGNSMSFKRRLLNRLVLLSTLILGAAAILPDVLHVPASWRPWVFVIAIAWLFAFCAGMFDVEMQ
jgi:hypothetical protein